MKLYTEEQVREAYLSGMYVTVSFEEMLQRLSPIELPSDEEISISSKQTAVEWLVEQVFGKHTDVWNDVIEQAKQMERHQIINAHLLGLIHPLEMEATKQAEQYYKETYED